MGCYLWYSEEGTGRAAAPPSPLLAVPKVTAHASTASVPITVLLYELYDGPLLCGFNVAIKRVNYKLATDYNRRAGSLLLFFGGRHVVLLFCPSVGPPRIMVQFTSNRPKDRNVFPPQGRHLGGGAGGLWTHKVLRFIFFM